MYINCINHPICINCINDEDGANDSGWWDGADCKGLRGLLPRGAGCADCTGRADHAGCDDAAAWTTKIIITTPTDIISTTIPNLMIFIIIIIIVIILICITCTAGYPSKGWVFRVAFGHTRRGARPTQLGD